MWCAVKSILGRVLLLHLRQQDIDQVSTSENSPPRTRARVSESLFCLKKCCLFCGDEANEEAEKKKAKKVRHKIHKVATLEFKESIVKVAWSRSDDEAKKVTARIEYEFDLVAAEAKYNNTCYNSFLRPTMGVKSVVLKLNLQMLRWKKYLNTLKIAMTASFH